MQGHFHGTGSPFHVVREWLSLCWLPCHVLRIAADGGGGAAAAVVAAVAAITVLNDTPLFCVDNNYPGSDGPLPTCRKPLQQLHCPPAAGVC
jgi:hypothetical protein